MEVYASMKSRLITTLVCWAAQFANVRGGVCGDSLKELLFLLYKLGNIPCGDKYSSLHLSLPIVSYSLKMLLYC